LHQELESLGVLVDELEVGLERSPDPLPVAGGRRQGGPDPLLELERVRVEQGQVQSLLRGEVVVEDGLRDAGLPGHVLHRDAVEPLGPEHLARHLEELRLALGPPHTSFGAGFGSGHGRYTTRR
jgi:hypothetical protein